MPDCLDLVNNAKAELGEGPVWDNRHHLLYWIDIEKHLVHIYDPVTEVDKTINVGQRIGCLSPRKAGGFVLGLEQGFGILDVESETVRLLIDPENHLPFLLFLEILFYHSCYK